MIKNWEDWLTRSAEGTGGAEGAGDSGAAEGDVAAPETEVVAGSTEVEAAPEAPQAASPPTKKPWYEARIGQLTARAAEKDRVIGDLQRQLAQQSRGEEVTDAQGRAVPVEEVRALAQRMALELAPQIAQARSFAERCNEVVIKGEGKYGADFRQRLGVMQMALGNNAQLPDHFLEAVLETDDPVEVVYSLAGDMDRAAEILTMSPARMAMALAKIDREIGGAPKAPQPKVSKTPAPPSVRVGSSGTTSSKSLYDEMSTEEWMEMRKKSLKR